MAQSSNMVGDVHRGNYWTAVDDRYGNILFEAGCRCQGVGLGKHSDSFSRPDVDIYSSKRLLPRSIRNKIMGPRSLVPRFFPM